AQCVREPLRQRLHGRGISRRARFDRVSGATSGFRGSATPAKGAAVTTTFPSQLDERFRAAAAAEGLLDVAFDVLDTDIGPLLVGVSDRGLCRIHFDPEPERDIEELARTYGSRVLRA